MPWGGNIKHDRGQREKDIAGMFTGVKCVNCKKEFNLFTSEDSEKCDDCYVASEEDTKVVPQARWIKGQWKEKDF
tara:strand:+ start:328 stop:552 length:225 start_codon:yes stop_codon:yes gene_type:complete